MMVHAEQPHTEHTHQLMFFFVFANITHFTIFGSCIPFFGPVFGFAKFCHIHHSQLPCELPGSLGDFHLVQGRVGKKLSEMTTRRVICTGLRSKGVKISGERRKSWWSCMDLTGWLICVLFSAGTGIKDNLLKVRLSKEFYLNFYYSFQGWAIVHLW